MSSSPQAQSDEDLVAEMILRDEQALGTLYDRWADQLYSLAIRILQNQQEAEEVVEDTFMEAWRRSEQYRSTRGTVGGWLFAIARSRSLDRYRRQERQRENGEYARNHLSLDELRGMRPDSAAVIFEEKERRDLVRRALRDLPPAQREAIEMAYFCDLSHAEIAEGLNQPLGTIKGRTRLALKKLRSYLKDSFDQDSR